MFPQEFIVMRPWNLALFMAVSMAVCPATPASAAEWIVARLSGEAWIALENGSSMRARAGMPVPDGATFTTGRQARARLERGTESVLVSPGTVLSPSSSFFGTTTIEHQAGRITLDVEKRGMRHFSVETPFLAAIVKGTRFTVAVARGRADVRVDRGLVEVTDLKTGERADIAPGQHASTHALGSGGLQVGGAGARPEVRAGEPRTPSIEGGNRQAGRGSAAADQGGQGSAGKSGQGDGKGGQGGNGKGGGRENDDGRGSHGRGEDGKGGRGNDDGRGGGHGHGEGRGGGGRGKG